MASGYTIFLTYNLIPTGYTQPIHCNYINRLQLDIADPYIQKINISFPNANDFKFLNSGSTTTGFSATQIHAIFQLVNNSGFTTIEDVVPDSAAWKYLDLTNQLLSYESGVTKLISSADLVNVVFEIPLLPYAGYPSYNLNYLGYPVVAETDKLSFGDEVYFLGNVTTDIKADVYVLELPISLLLDEFNSSTNATWDVTRDDSVAISEVGIYADVNGTKELVAIGKLNDPITKNSTISRTIVFAIDF